MSVLLLILLTAAEITLTVLTFTKFREKAAWLKNRMTVRAVQTALTLGIIVLPSINMKWRYFAALAVIAVRFVFSVIMWLVRRKKADGLKKKAFSVVGCVVSLILIFLSLVPAFVFTNYNGLPVTGKYSVAEAEAILIDKSRTEQFESDSSYREVPAHFFYPEDGSGSYPLVLFSHGAFGYYQSNYSTYAQLASNGYTVIALDHPYHSFFTKDSDGKTVIVNMDFINDVMKINEDSSNEEVFTLSQNWLKLRVDDENFVLNTVKEAKKSQSLNDIWCTDDSKTILGILANTDTEKIGLIGHSLGGASSVAVGRERNDVDAVIDLDGTMLGEIIGVKDGNNVYNNEAYRVPVLDFTKSSDDDDRQEYMNKYGYPYVNEYVIENAVDGKSVVFKDAEHMDFTDLPLFSPFLASQLGHGNIDSEKTMTVINGIVLNWFDYYLKGEGTLDIQAQY